MASYVYVGMTEKEKSALVKAKLAGMQPQDKRGQPLRYTIRSLDNEAIKEEKRKAVAEWLAARKKEIVADVDGLAQKRVVAGVVFEVGKPVKVEDTALEAKLKSLAPAFKLAEEKPKAKE